MLFAEHFSRFVAVAKSLLPYPELGYLNQWHLDDLLRISVVSCIQWSATVAAAELPEHATISLILQREEQVQPGGDANICITFVKGSEL